MQADIPGRDRRRQSHMPARLTTLIVLIALAGCAGQSLRERGPAVPDAGSPIARVYIERCGSCHAVPHPARHFYAGWRRLVPLMERRMAERGVRPLTDRERSDILAYLQAHAR